MTSARPGVARCEHALSILKQHTLIASPFPGEESGRSWVSAGLPRGVGRAGLSSEGSTGEGTSSCGFWEHVGP